MIHIIYIYFIINAFVAGLFHSDLGNWKYTVCWLLFGCAYPLLYLVSRILEILEIRTLFDLYFTENFSNFNQQQIDSMKIYYKHQVLNKRWYKIFILKIVDKKYNYGICNNNNK